MKNNKVENKLFIEACRKAGLKVQAKAGNQVAAGLIIRDGQGRKYIVNPEAHLKAVSPFESINIARLPKGVTLRTFALKKPARGIRHKQSKSIYVKGKFKRQED